MFAMLLCFGNVFWKTVGSSATPCLTEQLLDAQQAAKQSRNEAEQLRSEYFDTISSQLQNLCCITACNLTSGCVVFLIFGWRRVKPAGIRD